MAFRRSGFLFKLLLALVFVSAQQAAVLHALGHAFERSEQKDTTGLDDTFCAKCLALAQLDHAVGATPLDVAPVVFETPRSTFSPYENAPRTLVRRYESRAPPDLT